MDEYINEAFLNALKLSVTDKDLPLDSSVFYQNHLLLAKNPNVSIDLKNSTYKKIGKFLSVMAKADIIEYKEARKGTNPMISKVYRTCPKYESWVPTIKTLAVKGGDSNGGSS